MIGQEIGRGIFLPALPFVQNDWDLDATLVGDEQRFGDRCRDEAIGLHQDRTLGIAQDL